MPRNLNGGVPQVGFHGCQGLLQGQQHHVEQGQRRYYGEQLVVLDHLRWKGQRSNVEWDGGQPG